MARMLTDVSGECVTCGHQVSGEKERIEWEARRPVRL